MIIIIEQYITIYFDFTHNLGKEFGFKSNKSIANNYKNWIIYTSGVYKFYTEINTDENGFLNEFHVYKYSLKNSNYESIYSIRLLYFNESQNLIKSYEIEGNVNNKYIDSENHTFYYFLPGDNIQKMIEKESLKYIQIEFKLKFRDQRSSEALDELSVEIVSTKKIKEKKFNKNINNIMKENTGKLGIYYINLNEAIFELNQNVLFYSNTKKYSDILFFGNILCFDTIQDDMSNYIYNTEKQFIAFTKETINNYYSKNEENIILLIIDGNKVNEQLYEDNMFFEFKFLDTSSYDIIYNEEGNRSNIIDPKEILSFHSENECTKIKYVISYYSSLEKDKENIYFSKNIYGKISIYYINKDSIFSENVKGIDDILPDKDDKYLINLHPNEIAKGGLDIFSVTCKKVPSLSKFYTFEKKEQNQNINFFGDKNTFIGYIYPEDSSQLEKEYIFENKDIQEFNIKIKILKIIGLNGINIKYRKNQIEEYSEIKEGQERIINSIEDKPSFKINELGIGKGIIFLEIIKGINMNNVNLFDFIEDTRFNYQLFQNKYYIFKYNRTQINSGSVRIILFNEKNKDAKICVNYDLYIEPYISLPDCIKYEKISANSNINILIDNPYSVKKNLLGENNDNFYIILKSDSPIKYIYVYSNLQKNLLINERKAIFNNGEVLFQLEENNPEEKYFIYQLNQCNMNKSLYLNFGSKIYENFGNKIYGIQRKDESNMRLSIVNEGGNNQNPDFYFVLSESDINSENIDDIINQNASFSYKQDKNNIIFTIDNFAEEELEYYSIISVHNNTDELANFCFFIDFFQNNNSLFSKNISKGKGLNSKTITVIYRAAPLFWAETSNFRFIVAVPPPSIFRNI